MLLPIFHKEEEVVGLYLLPHRFSMSVLRSPILLLMVEAQEEDLLIL